MRRCLTRKKVHDIVSLLVLIVPGYTLKRCYHVISEKNHRHAIWITAGIAIVTLPIILHIWYKVDDRLYTGRAMNGVHIDTSRQEITFKTMLPTSVSYLMGNVLLKSLRLISSVGLVIHKFNNNGNPHSFDSFEPKIVVRCRSKDEIANATKVSISPIVYFVLI